MKLFIIYLSKAVGLGLLIAVVVLFAVPDLRFAGQHFLFNTQAELAPKLSFSQAANRAAPAVVNIYTRNFQKNSLTTEPELSAEGLGSGVLMTEDGHVLTNYHVVANADQIIIALQDGRIFAAQLVGGDLLTDLAVLKIDADNLPAIPISTDVLPQVGDVVLAIGNPYNVGQTITQGIISATGRVGMSSTRRQDFLQTDAAINRGNSGGALVNTRGELVGINTAAFELEPGHETFGISFAIPSVLAVKIMNSLIREGEVTRGYLGLDGFNVTPATAQLWNLNNVRGVMVRGSDPEGPARKAGIKVNDIIVKVGTKEITNVKEAMDIVAETPPETKLIFTVLRRGEQIEIPVIIEELKFNSQVINTKKSLS